MTTIQIRTQADTKKNAQQILSELGIDMTTAINMYLVQIAKQGGIPFAVLTENGMTLKAERELLQASQEAKSSRKTYASSQELHDSIMSE